MLALFLAVACATALAACGSSDNAKLLPGATASQITANLEEVRRLAAEGECIGAENAASAVSEQVDGLNGVDKKLKQALGEGAARLNEVVTSCEEDSEAEAEEAREAEEEEEFEAEQKATEKSEKTEEKAAEKAEKAEEKEQSKEEKEPPVKTPEPPAEEKEEEIPPTEPGGETGSGGVGPGAPAGES
ncbi:MAG: hypothetical protein H0X42_00670 [Solirubrobacterales bacterium]|nr:hypothetical protein [Solirubrobacterales bacterium]